jgi:hypothetical protein
MPGMQNMPDASITVSAAPWLLFPAGVTAAILLSSTSRSPAKASSPVAVKIVAFRINVLAKGSLLDISHA